MKLARSSFTDVLTVHAGDTHWHIQPGEVVDLDEVVAHRMVAYRQVDDKHAEATSEPVTLADALGSHVGMFVSVSQEVTAPPAAAPPAALAFRKGQWSETPAVPVPDSPAPAAPIKE